MPNDVTRKSERVRCRTRVSGSVDQHFFSNFTNDIGFGGVCITVDAQLPAGSATVLQLRLPGDDSELKLHGKVVWSKACDDGIRAGVAFIESSAKLAPIIQFVRNSAAA